MSKKKAFKDLRPEIPADAMKNVLTTTRMQNQMMNRNKLKKKVKLLEETVDELTKKVENGKI